MVGLQNYAQLSHLYGMDGAKALSSLLNTRFIFRQPDPAMAQWSAHNLGGSIEKQVREGISYGANSLRDSVSVQRIEQQKPVVYPSDILRLENLQAYLRLPGPYPICSLRFDYHPGTDKHLPFIPYPITEPATKQPVKNNPAATKKTTRSTHKRKDKSKPSEDKPINHTEKSPSLNKEAFLHSLHD